MTLFLSLSASGSDFTLLLNHQHALRDLFANLKAEAVEVTPIESYGFQLHEGEEDSIVADWHEIVKPLTKRGLRILQIQVCTSPLSPGLRDLLNYLASEEESGEEYRAIRSGDFRTVAGDWPMQDQFWICDDSRAIVAHFDTDGRLSSTSRLDTGPILARLVNLKASCLELSTPVASFLATENQRE